MHALFTVHWYGCRGCREKFKRSVYCHKEIDSLWKSGTKSIIMPRSRIFLFREEILNVLNFKTKNNKNKNNLLFVVLKFKTQLGLHFEREIELDAWKPVFIYYMSSLHLIG